MESSVYKKNLTQWGVVHQFDEKKEWSRHTDANFNIGFCLFYQSETLDREDDGEKDRKGGQVQFRGI